jgi:hypothetical protein
VPAASVSVSANGAYETTSGVQKHYFPLCGDALTPDEAGMGDGMVGRAEGSSGQEGLAGWEQAADGAGLADLERFLEGERGKEGRQPLGQHGLPRARRTDPQHVWVRTPTCRFACPGRETLPDIARTRKGGAMSALPEAAHGCLSPRGFLQCCFPRFRRPSRTGTCGLPPLQD